MNYPFCYVPAPEIVEAAEKLIDRIDETIASGGQAAKELLPLREGKMLGVLITDRGPLYAFSGTVGGKATLESRFGDAETLESRFIGAERLESLGDAAGLESRFIGDPSHKESPGEAAGFVPPIYDITLPGGYFRTREAEISAMPPGPERSAASAELQDWIFEHYRVLNARGESLNIKEVFARRGIVPPGGTGDCAAPKLLQYAYLHGLKPLKMGEFWYGHSPAGEVREQGRFYPSCTGKCGPLLSFMMEGLEVEPNPLDREYTTDAEPSVIYEDDTIIVADKPSGMLSVPGRTKAKSLLEWLQERFGEVHSCHRLDMDTSGVMVFARNLEAKVELERQFAERETEKTYRARLCSGTTPFHHAPRGTIALPLAPDWYDRPRQMVDRENGKLAVTRYEVLQMLPDGEVEVLFMPKTGRTHQLRVHAAHHDGLGRPIKGDRLYGAAESSEQLWLRAESLTIKHPKTYEKVTFSTSPADPGGKPVG